MSQRNIDGSTETFLRIGFNRIDAKHRGNCQSSFLIAEIFPEPETNVCGEFHQQVVV